MRIIKLKKGETIRDEADNYSQLSRIDDSSIYPASFKLKVIISYKYITNTLEIEPYNENDFKKLDLQITEVTNKIFEEYKKSPEKFNGVSTIKRIPGFNVLVEKED